MVKLYFIELLYSYISDSKHVLCLYLKTGIMYFRFLLKHVRIVGIDLENLVTFMLN